MLRHAGLSIAGQREYVINHALTREVAYETLLKSKRGPLHAGFAQWLEQNRKGEDEHAALLAHHYAEAVRPEDLDLAWCGREEQAERLRGKAIGVVPAGRGAGYRPVRDRRGPGAARPGHQPRKPPARAGRDLAADRSGLCPQVQRRPFLAGDAAGAGPCRPSAEVYADLALQSVMRAGMWVQEPDWTLVDGWIQQALELAGESSLAKANAFTALA